MTTRFKATTLLDVYRDNTGLAASGCFDGYSDDADSVTPLNTEPLPAHVINKTIKVYDKVTGRISAIETWRARLRPDADVFISDRIKDRQTGHWFTVDAVVAPDSVIGTADVRLEMTRIAR